MLLRTDLTERLTPGRTPGSAPTIASRTALTVFLATARPPTDWPSAPLQESLDHCVDLIGHLELIEVTRSDRAAEDQLGTELLETGELRSRPAGLDIEGRDSAGAGSGDHVAAATLL